MRATWISQRLKSAPAAPAPTHMPRSDADDRARAFPGAASGIAVQRDAAVGKWLIGRELRTFGQITMKEED